jgi:PAS domain S-box-containing protein
MTFQTDKNGIITDVSKKFCKVFDYLKDDIIGQDVNRIKCDSCQSESFQKLMLNAIHTKKSVVSHHTLVTNENKNIECSVTLTPKYGADLLVEGYLIYLDV